MVDQRDIAVGKAMARSKDPSSFYEELREAGYIVIDAMPQVDEIEAWLRKAIEHSKAKAPLVHAWAHSREALLKIARRFNQEQPSHDPTPPHCDAPTHNCGYGKTGPITPCSDDPRTQQPAWLRCCACGADWIDGDVGRVAHAWWSAMLRRRASF